MEVNMEVPITAGEVMQAGGLGATDNIGTILPAAIDSTDFEDHLRDVRLYEGSDEKTAEGGKAANNGVINNGEEPKTGDAYYEAVNMEAYVTSDEVMRAGGFGATDDISSFLPVASDFTDFEESLRDARDYEDSEEKSSRPGLGWKDD